jgi:hypothetical protein
MWTTEDITVEIEDAEDSVMIVAITTPAGVVRICGSVTVVGRTLRIDGAHVGGVSPGALGRAGLNVIAQKLLMEADVDEIVIQGSARTSGRYRGKVPRAIRFPRR